MWFMFKIVEIQTCSILAARPNFVVVVLLNIYNTSLNETVFIGKS